MVDHARKTVREAAVADLTGLTTTGGNVFTGRTAPLTTDEMPGLVVRIREEDADWDSIGADGGRIARRGRLIVEGSAAAAEDAIEDLLDTIAAEVEAAIFGNATPTLDPLLQNIGPPTTQIDIPDDQEGEDRIGFVRILIPVAYRTALADPTTIV